MKKIFISLIVGTVMLTDISCHCPCGNITNPAVITETIPLPRGRGGHAAGMLNGHVVVIGGTDWSADHTEKFWLNDSIILIDGSWRPGPTLPHPIAYSLFAYDKTGIYLAGGTDGVNNLTTVYRLSNDGNKYSWNALPSLPAAAASGSGALLNGVLYVTCGWTDQGISNQIWSLDVSQPNTDWLPCQILPGPKRAFPALTACGDYLYLFGGMSPDPNSDPLGVLQDAYRYNPQEDTWLRLKDLPCKGYGWSASPIDKDHVLLTGKADGKISKDIYLIDVRDMTATQIGQTVIQTTTAPLVKVKSDEFWLIAGEPDSNKNRTNRITAIKTN